MGDHTDSFQIQIISDLHLEIERPNAQLYIYEFPVCAPNLVLLGDIGWTRDERLFQWLEVQLSRFKRCLWSQGIMSRMLQIWFVIPFVFQHLNFSRSTSPMVRNKAFLL